MAWRDWPYWLKGSMIVSIIYLVSWILFIFFTGYETSPIKNILSYLLLAAFIAPKSLFNTEPTLGIIISFSFYFVIGAFIGFI